MISNSEKCPWCGSEITREKFNEIETKIRNEEQKKQKEVESALQKRFELEKQNIETRLQNEAKENFTNLSRQLNNAQEKIKQLEANKDEVFKQAQKEAEKKLAEEREKEIKNLRIILERDSSQKLLKQQDVFSQEREGYQKKINELSTQLQKKNAQEIEGTSINLFEELQAAFPEDGISYIDYGEPNEKLVHKVLYKGIDCGIILIDSRNRQSWQKSFATKLRIEQLDLVADHAILATTVFPKGKRDLCIEGEVIVAHPSCVAHILDLLRNVMIKMCIQGLSLEDRSSKTSRLYEFISSESYKQKRNEASTLTNDILELDVEEQKQHKKTWAKRGTLATRLKNVLRDIDSDINVILEEKNQNKTRTTSLPRQKQDYLRKVV